MKRRVGLVSTFVIGVLMSGVAWSVPGMQAHAQDASSPSNWWFHGTVEVGGRFFLNNPQKDGRADLNQKSLAKYYEYSSNKPGPFSNVDLSAGTKDGLYQFNFGGYNIGYNDERFFLDYSKAGKQYLTLSWDQTPHVYSKSAQTIFNTNGNVLSPGCTYTAAAANTNNLLGCERTTDIAIHRDTAAAKYRWTPTDAWDITADYSHMRRTGSQIAGIVLGSQSPVQVPRPVADTTQNYGLNGEYVGTSPWGKKIVANLGYAGSQYTDDYSAYYVQNPFTAVPAIANNTPLAQISTPPSNNANGFNTSVAADLPWKSRYVGTVSYNAMRQDAGFNSMSTAAAYVLPAASLNGKIDTTLVNNVVTTKVLPNLTSKLTYRYYDYDNRSPELQFLNWIPGDRPATSAGHNVNAISINYTKQNAGEEWVWQPNKQWNLGAVYGYERYDYTRVDVSATSENSGKFFTDYKPTSWLTARSSVSYGSRRYQNYDYLNNVGLFQWVGTSTSTQYQSSFRQFMISNREQWKANFLVDVVVAPGLTITPTFKYLDEQYGVNPANQQGLKDRRLWSAGIDSTFVLNPRTTFQLGYSRDFATQLLFGTSCTNNVGTCLNGGALTPNYPTLTNDKATYDTVIAVVRHAAIPDKLDTELRYVASRGIDSLQLMLGNAAIPAGGQFPDMTTWYQRLDATATYKFDQETVTRLGLKGQMKAKLRYTWERNSVSWWATDMVGVIQGTGVQTNLLMAGDNPNYNVHLIAASLAYSW